MLGFSKQGYKAKLIPTRLRQITHNYINILYIYVLVARLLLLHRWPQPSRQGTAHRNIAWYKTSGGYRLNDNGPKCLKTTSSGLYLS